MRISAHAPKGWTPIVGEEVLALYKGKKVIQGKFVRFEDNGSKAVIFTWGANTFVTELLPILKQQELL